MSHDISIVRAAQGYFDTSLQTFDLFGAGDGEKNREGWIPRRGGGPSVSFLVFSHVVLTHVTSGRTHDSTHGYMSRGLPHTHVHKENA